MGSGLAFVAVALGAFGTHGLRDRLSPANLQIWQTGVQYHMIHAVGLILIGILHSQFDSKVVTRSGWFLYYGILIFSGSLYVLALTDIRVIGAITPLGGLCFLAGWGSLAYTMWKGSDSVQN